MNLCLSSAAHSLTLCPELVAYGSTLRGVALAAAEALLTLIPRLLNVQDLGSWDMEQSQLAWLMDISRGGARKLLMSTLTYFQSCSWHDGENVKKQLHSKVHDSTLHRPLTKYHAVLSGTVTPAQYEQLAPRATPPSWLTYLRDNRFSTSLLPRLDRRISALVDKPPLIMSLSAPTASTSERGFLWHQEKRLST